MKPSRLQHILAYSFEISAVAGILAAWAVCFELVDGGAPPVPDFSYLAGILIVALLSIPVGAFAGLLCLGPSLQWVAGKRNGAPFKRGDSVKILRGPLRGTVTHVYETWDSRNQVRVDLGEEKKKAIDDVFEIQQVCRA